MERDRNLFQAIEDLEENLPEKSKTQEMKKPPKKVKLAKRSNGEIHAELIKPINRDEWIEKIWKTEKMESHENAEPVEILYWFKYNGAKNQGLKIRVSRYEMVSWTLLFTSSDNFLQHPIVKHLKTLQDVKFASWIPLNYDLKIQEQKLFSVTLQGSR